MDRLISESKMSREFIVQRSGLSRDYIYEKMSNPESDVEVLSEERDRIVKARIEDEDSAAKDPEQRAALIEMIKVKLLENGIEF